MSWTRRSEKRFTGWLRNAATAALPVLRLGVWQRAHPVSVNSFRPLAMDSTPPGVLGEGAGAARKRAKKANFSIALTASTGVLPSVLVTVLGTVANWQVGVSSRSV